MSKLTPSFLVFEGIEGAGKSTLIQGLSAVLRTLGQEVLITREPGGTDLADKIRALLLSPTLESMHSYTELCLLAAARSQHVQEVLKPALAKNIWVLCDRFTDSTIAYQGYGRGIPQNIIASINTMVCDGIAPDHVIVCDVDPGLAMDRIKQRHKDRIEEENVLFFEKIRAGYLKIAQASSRHFLLDSNVSQQQMLSALLHYLHIEYRV